MRFIADGSLQPQYVLTLSVTLQSGAATDDRRTECLVNSTFRKQARLQDLGRVLRVTLALNIEKTAADERQVLRDTFELFWSA